MANAEILDDIPDPVNPSGHQYATIIVHNIVREVRSITQVQVQSKTSMYYVS